MRRGRRWTFAAVLVAAGVLAGCAGDEPSAAPTRTPTGVPIVTPTTIEERCKVPVEGDLTTFPAPDGSVVPGAVLGEGDTVAVLLHQTSSSGFCGFSPYAEWLAGQGIRAVLVDLCGWGRAQCKGAFATDQEAQVRLPVEWARAHGATRVVLVGASLGAALSVGFGQQVGADAIVSLSGPAEWPDLPPAGPAARSITVPLLVAIDPADREMQPAALEAAVASAPARTKRFVETDGGHGWAMLGESAVGEPTWYPLATTVRDWVLGRYAA